MFELKNQPKFDDPRFRSVPIITAWNSQKDKINDLGAEWFAQDTSQDLVVFFSLSPNLPCKVKLPSFKALNAAEKTALWNAHPCTSEHMAGKLSLCLGMPVMIRNNDATELCITKANTGPDGQSILDILFVKLIDPPKSVLIPGLDKNVVALSKASKKIWYSFPNDMIVSIMRDQVLVLPNFAMTDYTSQDLHNCWTHFSYYTCLSHSSTAEGTVIVQGVESKFDHQRYLRVLAARI
ncbi:hypothetical protein B0H10DRAFT_2165019 [Mycena sp. CBHHK59/15]|nr:hypothetical protein B0H10DRAFT_2165019 [Mycena sp. CBHHK59/15]